MLMHVLLALGRESDRERLSRMLRPESSGPPSATTRTGLPAVWPSIHLKMCLPINLSGIKDGYLRSLVPSSYH